MQISSQRLASTAMPSSIPRLQPRKTSIYSPSKSSSYRTLFSLAQPTTWASSQSLIIWVMGNCDRIRNCKRQRYRHLQLLACRCSKIRFSSSSSSSSHHRKPTSIFNPGPLQQVEKATPVPHSTRQVAMVSFISRTKFKMRLIRRQQAETRSLTVGAGLFCSRI